MVKFGGGYMSQVKMVPRWGKATGVIAVIYTTVVALVIWAILADPRGPFKFYTPLYWFAIANWLILPVLWMHLIFEDHPFTRFGPKKKGALMIPVSLFISLFSFYVFMWYIYGFMAIPYFSWPKLQSMGLSPLVARSYSCFGNITAVFIGLFAFAFWPILFENWPWKGKLQQPSLGFAVFSFSALMGVFLFQILFQPHYGEAFPTSQAYAIASPPWWQSFSLTYHGFFTVGWFLWAIVYLFLTATIWEGKPWTAVKKQPWRGIFGFLGIIGISWLTMYLCLAIMDILLGPGIPGGRRAAGLPWRYLHSGEIAAFILPAAVYLYYYFNNWPRKFSPEANWLIRTFLVFLFGWITGLVYYAVGAAALGVPTTWDSEVQFPIAWIVWWLVVILYNAWYMDRWPAFKPVKP